MATMKGIVIMVLIFFSLIALMQSLLTLLWSIYPVTVQESANGAALFGMGVGFLATSIFVWKKWEDEDV
jgi:membrane associated rhomboid family serine protease